MSRRDKDRKGKRERKRIDHYKQSGKKLQPPLATYPNIELIDYHRQLLPQLLWLESLIDLYGEEEFPRLVRRFLDLVDTLGITGAEPVSGFVESFAFVPEAPRQSFVDSNRRAVEVAVIEPFGAALQLYSDCPMNWLLASYGDTRVGFDLDSAVASLKRWTTALVDRTGAHSNMARVMVFARYLKAGKARIPDRGLIDELKVYPRCRDRGLTESRIRADSNAIFGQVVRGFTWGDAFWATNGRITMCSARMGDEQDSATQTQERFLRTLIDHSDQAADGFLTAIRADHQKCIPDPSTFEKTSVLSGLLARASALGLDVLRERSLWVAEVGGIMLRCLCETLILLAWLLRKDDMALYRRFVQYSLGQQDLYGLKLQDYEGYREAFKALYIGDDKLADVMSEDSWDAQMRTIDLGNWAGIDTRKMAEQGGTKVYYDLVFSLCSADVHSQFISIARWNMVPCTNPLHNYHLLPAWGRRSVNPFLPLSACVLLKEACHRFFEHYKVDATCTRVLESLLNDASGIMLNASPAPT
ncbi:MAG: hypothetical protein JSU86_04145 [Phycisphaerales bacterium]|nr:MAG: hypothetical protein JSU86_04145 [Phycisphaerales bacterium]